jgi:deoxyhypusine synthase
VLFQRQDLSKPSDLITTGLMATKGPVSEYLLKHFKHFNAATVVDAAKGYEEHLSKGGKMFVTLAGAMSTAELGKSVAEMIRQGKIHGVCCTGANLEEDIFNLVAHKHYKRIPNWRDLTPEQELNLLEEHMNRVTDTCIPEGEAMRAIENHLVEQWSTAEKEGKRYFPHEFIYKIIESGKLKSSYQIDPKDSWVMAAYEKKLPIFVPGWEDSTTANFFASHCIEKRIKSPHTVKSGIEYMIELANWYEEITKNGSLGFFQVGGGIAGDFPICVVPMLHQDLQKTNVPLWGYFCQISDSTTSYGSYSGAVPNEKITWGKLGVKTPKFIVESDATIVAPLIFAYVLGQ